ncbi:putative fatty-acyl-CoA-transporting ATPase [Rosa chinensis]|uniref:Putative fatty-acyl-CoA-transporting ATPase n=1 Tax=Rosa chinensis TaxID=74649 RepID=A0A2P6S5A1_ROSCH|nr:putative fatty-acyl-CoA-transporting ATPase [Rosa chinensis]
MEADFHYGLVRIRENAESIAFYSGEAKEMQHLLQCFKSAFENLTQLLIASRNLEFFTSGNFEFFTSGYCYLIQILPAAVIAPMYFSRKIELGVINQSVSAFNHILGDFSLTVYQFQSISAFSTVIDRLDEFDDYLDISSQRPSDPAEGISFTYSNVKTLAELEPNGSIPIDKQQKLLDIENLTVQTPSSTTLVRDLSLVINNNENLLVTGPSGSGKTYLLRILAGLWSAGRGEITFYVEDEEEIVPSNSPGVGPLGTANDKYGEHERPSNRSFKGIFFVHVKRKDEQCSLQMN